MTENDLSPRTGPSAPVGDADFKGFMRDFEAHMTGLGERAERVRPLIEATGLHVSSEGGEVTVTVTADGALLGIAFAEGPRTLDEHELAAVIIATYDRAVAEAERGSEA